MNTLTRTVELFGSMAGDHFPHLAGGGDIRVRDEAQRYLVTFEIAEKHQFIDIENSVAVAVLRQRECPLSRLHHLANLEISRRDHTGGAGAQFGVLEGLFRRPQLRLRGFKLTFRGPQSFLRLIEQRPGGESIGNEGLLPLKPRRCHAQLQLRRRHRRGRSIEIGLLLGRIDPSERRRH